MAELFKVNENHSFLDKLSDSPIPIILLLTIIIITIIIVVRDLSSWYWKIDERINLQKEENQKLQTIIDIQNKQIQLLETIIHKIGSGNSYHTPGTSFLDEAATTTESNEKQ